MKNVLFALLQFFLFLIVFAAGSFLPPFHVEHVLGISPEGTRVFIWDGVLLTTLLFLVILLIESLRKRVATSGPWTVGAFVLAGIVGYALKFGLLTR